MKSRRLSPIFWNLLTFGLTIALLLGGRTFALELGRWIPDGRNMVIRYGIQSADQAVAVGTGTTQAATMPFEQLTNQNSRIVTPDELTNRQDYEDMIWWVDYLCWKMLDPDLFQNEENEAVLRVYEDTELMAGPADDITDGSADSESAGASAGQEVTNLVIDRRYKTADGLVWTLHAAYNTVYGLDYLQLETQQYWQGELKINQAMRQQATRATGFFIRQLNRWLNDAGRQPPDCRLTDLADTPDSFTTEGLIGRAAYAYETGGGSFAVYYNFATMQVVGFAWQAA
ncbi:MAG: hypothetical protein VB070_07725 [Clostridiaceae bacterium]|nr:hypothetical protein [Clostridiaceae bacterium]